MLHSETGSLRKISIGALAITAASMPFSIRLCHWSYLFFIACWLLQAEWKQKWLSLSVNRAALLLPVFFLFHVAGMFYTDNATSGWEHLEKKGAFVLIPLTLATTAMLNRTEFNAILRVFVIACLAATLICVGHAFWSVLTDSGQQNFGGNTMAEFQRLNPGASLTWMNFSYVSLASGIGMHPTYVGLYLSFCLLIIVHFIRNNALTGSQRRIAIALFVYLLVFIVFLSSRVTIITAIAIAFSALIILTNQRTWQNVLPRLVAAGLLFAALMYSNPVSRFRGLQEPANASLGSLPVYATTSIEIRLSLLELTRLATSSVDPWLGAGTGAGVDFLRAEGTAHGISNVLNSYDPHNQFIYTFLELGVPGLIALLLVFGGIMYFARKKKSYLCTGFVLVFVAVCLTESALELQKGIVLFAFFSSLLLFHEDPAQAAS